MAIIFSGISTCVLCDQVLESDKDIVMIPPFVEGAFAEFLAYSDAAFHKSCFMTWEKRQVLIYEYNEYYRNHYRGMRVMDEEGHISNVD